MYIYLNEKKIRGELKKNSKSYVLIVNEWCAGQMIVNLFISTFTNINVKNIITSTLLIILIKLAFYIKIYINNCIEEK